MNFIIIIQMDQIYSQKLKDEDDVNIGSSESESSRELEMRKIKKQSKSTKSGDNNFDKKRKSQESLSQERYRILVQENKRKNDEIWIKQSHKVRIPKIIQKEDKRSSTSSSFKNQLREIQHEINSPKPMNGQGMQDSDYFERSGSQRENIGKFRESNTKRIKYDSNEIQRKHQSEKSDSSQLSVHSLEEKAPNAGKCRDRSGNRRVPFAANKKLLQQAKIKQQKIETVIQDFQIIQETVRGKKKNLPEANQPRMLQESKLQSMSNMNEASSSSDTNLTVHASPRINSALEDINPMKISFQIPAQEIIKMPEIEIIQPPKVVEAVEIPKLNLQHTALDKNFGVAQLRPLEDRKINEQSEKSSSQASSKTLNLNQNQRFNKTGLNYHQSSVDEINEIPSKPLSVYEPQPKKRNTIERKIQSQMELSRTETEKTLGNEESIQSVKALKKSQQSNKPPPEPKPSKAEKNPYASLPPVKPPAKAPTPLPLVKAPTPQPPALKPRAVAPTPALAGAPSPAQFISPKPTVNLVAKDKNTTPIKPISDVKATTASVESQVDLIKFDKNMQTSERSPEMNKSGNYFSNVAARRSSVADVTNNDYLPNQSFSADTTHRSAKLQILMKNENSMTEPTLISGSQAKLSPPQFDMREIVVYILDDVDSYINILEQHRSQDARRQQYASQIGREVFDTPLENPVSPITQNYEISQIQEQVSADEQSRQVTNRSHKQSIPLINASDATRRSSIGTLHKFDISKRDVISDIKKKKTLQSTNAPIVSIEANIAAKWKNPYNESEGPTGFASCIVSNGSGKRPTGDHSGRRNDINRSFKTTETNVEGRRETFDMSPDIQFYQDTVVRSQDPKNLPRFRQSWNPHQAKLPSQLMRNPQFPNVMSDTRLGHKKVNEEPVKPTIRDQHTYAQNYFRPQVNRIYQNQEQNADLRVPQNFNLSEFMNQYKLQSILTSGQSSNREKFSLAIHDFHKQQNGYKNQGPDRFNIDKRKQPHQSLDSARRESPTRGLVFDQNLIINFQRQLQNNQIDVNQAYLLVQCIQRSHGQQMMNDAEIRKHAMIIGSGSRDRSNSLVRQYKQREILKFMKSNPQVLYQTMQMLENESSTTNTQSESQFFSRRPRYTEKIIQQIYQGLPGLIGNLQNQSMMMANQFGLPKSKKLKQPKKIVSKERHQYQNLSTEKPNRHATCAPIVVSNQSSPPQTQNVKLVNRLKKKSLSPIDRKHIQNARKAKNNNKKQIAHSESRSLFTRDVNPMSDSNRYKIKGPSSLERNNLQENVMPQTQVHLKKPLQSDNAQSAYYNQYQNQFTVTHDAEQNIINIERPSGNLKKPKTNQGQRHQQLQIQEGQHTEVINSRSVHAPDDFKEKFGIVEVTAYGTIFDGNSDERTQQKRVKKKNNNDVRTELTSGGSLVPSKLDELLKQKQVLDNEETELAAQRKQIVAEKDKVTRQLKRLDRKEELMAQEELVRKQRLILEVEKKRLREDINELDQLKQMLEQKKKETHTGFSDLAESNKELRSLKSGDLHRGISRQSGRSKNNLGALPKLPAVTMSHNETNNSISGQDPPILGDNGRRYTQPNAEPLKNMHIDVHRSTTIEQRNGGVNDLSSHTPQVANRMISVQSKVRQSTFENYPSPIRKVDVGKSNITYSPSQMSQSNMTFLSTNGVFDWAQSKLMSDVINDKVKFNSEDSSIYTEEDVYNKIEQVKQNPKSLRQPEKLQSVFQMALNTLQELMSCMNQTILFQMIAKKYTEVNLDNTVKLLVRCKQVLMSRQLAYSTLSQISKFEENVAYVKQTVDKFLESSMQDKNLSELKVIALSLPEQAKKAIENITELRDQYKLFSKMGATTSKGNQVLNVMAYKRRDAIRYLQREYDSIKRLLMVVDINIKPLEI